MSSKLLFKRELNLNWIIKRNYAIYFIKTITILIQITISDVFLQHMGYFSETLDYNYIVNVGMVPIEHFILFI